MREPAAPQGGLVRNIVHAIAGAGAYQVAVFCATVLLARLTSAEVVGAWNYAVALALPVSSFFSLQLRAALVSDADAAARVHTYASLRTLATAAMGLVFAVILAFELWRGASSALLLVILGVFIGRLAWNQAELAWGLFQRQERLDRVGLAHGLRGGAIVVAFAIALPWVRFASPAADGARGADSWLPGIAMLLYAALWWAAYAGAERPEIRAACRSADSARPNGRQLLELLRQTLPLGLVLLIVNLCDSVPRVLVREGSEAALGYFAALSSVAIVGNLAAVTVATASANRLALYYQTDLPRFFRLAGRLLLGASSLAVTMFVTAWLLGEWFLRVAFGPEYAAYRDAFLVLIGGYCIGLYANMFGAFATNMRLFWVQVPMQLTILAVTVLAAWLLIRGEDPVAGCAWTMTIRSVVQTALYGGQVTLVLWSRRREVRAGG